MAGRIGAKPVARCACLLVGLFRSARIRLDPRPIPATLAIAWLLLFPHFARAADLLEATTLLRQGEYADCIAAAQKGIEEAAYNEAFPLLKIDAEMQLGRYADALKTLDEALQRFPNSVQLRWAGRDVCRFNGQADRATKLETEILDLARQAPWRYSDTASQLVLGQLMLQQGADPKKVLDSIFKELQRRQPNYVDVLLASGDLALAKHDYHLAGDHYQKATKLDPENAKAWFGVARSFAPSDAEKAEEAIATALKHNPNHVDSLLLLVDEHVDSERYDEADKLLAQVAAINSKHPTALAYRAVLAHLRNQPEVEKLQRAAALRHWSTNPEIDHLIGRKLSQKYRFTEGEQYQRQALQLDPNYLPAKEQLAQDLLRLGREEEGLKLAEEVYAVDAYNVLAHNLVTLQENLAKFRSLEEDGFVVRMDAREAEIYGQRVLALLKRAKAELLPKYEVELDQPIIVEIFPRQQDFAIRTFGLPGGAGFLGVCFGTVITANSPASQGASPSCWEATLWHEFCHVVTLHKTHNKMPRWLSEGISVYEERQADRRWGQSMNPRYREMILGDDLTPVSQLSSAFLQPKSPLHLQFAYFESSLVVEYLVDKHGLDVLKRVLVDLGVGMPINESLARYVGSIDALDAEFADYARAEAKALAPEADWSKPELPRRASAEDFETFLKDHPSNYAALRQLAEKRMSEKKWESAVEPLEKMARLYPEDVSDGGPYKLLASVYRGLEQNQKEREVLEKVAERSADDVEAFSRLTELTTDGEEWQQTRTLALQWLGASPLVPEPHRRAAEAATALDDYALAAESYRALLLLDPFDPSEAHFQLAKALHAQGETLEAKKHVLLALEQSPRYRAAQRLLLKLVDEASANPSPQPPPKSPESEPSLTPPEVKPATKP